jgi:hypothetical protein
MYAKNKWLARIVSPYTGFDSGEDAPSDALILETNSRCDTADEAYRNVFWGDRTSYEIQSPPSCKKDLFSIQGQCRGGI